MPGRSYPDTRLTFIVRKVNVGGGGGWTPGLENFQMI